MKSQSGNKKLMVDINITPFTDVVLVLLIIFMVATPLLYQGKIKINLPQAKANQTEEKPQKVTVMINDKGEVYIDDVRYEISGNSSLLKDRIKASIGNSSESAIVINADRNCKYDSVMAVIDLSKELNIKRIILGTQVKK